LRAEMDRQPDLRAVAKGVQDGAQHMPRTPLTGRARAWPSSRPALQGLVEHGEVGSAHAFPSMIAPWFWSGNALCRPQIPTPLRCFRSVQEMFGVGLSQSKPAKSEPLGSLLGFD
jgi:hypothetical protein